MSKHHDEPGKLANIQDQQIPPKVSRSARRSRARRKRKHHEKLMKDDPVYRQEVHRKQEQQYDQSRPESADIFASMKSMHKEEREIRAAKITGALEAAGVEYVDISEGHIRVQGILSIYPPSGKYHHIPKNKRGMIDTSKEIIGQIRFLLNW